MRISDWSSDVCSSDLDAHVTPHGALPFLELVVDVADLHVDAAALDEADPRLLERSSVARALVIGRVLRDRQAPQAIGTGLARAPEDIEAVGRAEQADALDRKSVVWGKRVYVRVENGGGR